MCNACAETDRLMCKKRNIEPVHRTAKLLQCGNAYRNAFKAHARADV
jgi:hypothetical protein